MNTRLLIGVAAAVGMLASGQAAHAEGASFNVQPNLASGASGTYHVSVNRGSNTASPFNVIVTGNNDGRTAPGPNPVFEPEKHSIGRITVVFLRANGSFIQPNAAGSFGASTTGGGKTAGPYTVALTPGADGVRYNSQSNQNDVAAFGGNRFEGQAALGSAEQVAYFKVSLQNGGQQWTATVPASNVIPEPASLALVLPGLGPVALMLLRRRSRRGASSEDESTDLPTSN